METAHGDDRVASDELAADSAENLSTATTLQGAKDDILYVGIRDEVRRSDTCSAHGRHELALKHLREAKSLNEDYNGSFDLRRALRTRETTLVLSSRHVEHARPTKRRRALSMQHPVSSVLSRDSHTSDKSDLFAALLAQMDTEPMEEVIQDYNEGRSRTQSAHPAEDRNGPKRAADSARSTTGSFEGIEHFLKRVHPGQSPQHAEGQTKPKGASDSARLTRSNFEGINNLLERVRPGKSLVRDSYVPQIDAADKVRDWQTHVWPHSPSLFGPSELPSPRRHSLPVATPLASPTATTTHNRKKCGHTIPEPMRASSPVSPIDNTVDDSVSEYTRRGSHDETSSELSDTPALSTLFQQVEPNPFSEHHSPIAIKIRRLSTDNAIPAPLTIPTAIPHEKTEPTVPSPLRESFIADEVLVASPLNIVDSPTKAADVVDSSSSSRDLQRRTSLRTGTGTSPSTSSPLCRTFEPRHSIAQSTGGSEHQASSRLPKPMRKGAEVFERGMSLQPSSKATEYAGPQYFEKKAATQATAAPPWSITEPVQKSALSTKHDLVDKVGTAPDTPGPITGSRSPFHGSSSTSVLSSSITGASLPAKSSSLPSVTKPVSTNISTFASTMHQPATLTTSHRPTTSPSVSSLASKFEAPPRTHRQSAASSSSTQRAFADGLARAQSTRSSPRTPPISSPITRQPLKLSPERIEHSTHSRTQSPTSSRANAKTTITGRSRTSSPKPSTTSAPKGSTSVSQRILALNERPPWQRPGKIAVSKGSGTSHSCTSTGDGTRKARPWERTTSGTSPGAAIGARSGSTSTHGVPGIPEARRGRVRDATVGGDGDVEAVRPGSSASNRSSVTSQNAGFVRFGSEMGRGAGVVHR